MPLILPALPQVWLVRFTTRAPGGPPTNPLWQLGIPPSMRSGPRTNWPLTAPSQPLLCRWGASISYMFWIKNYYHPMKNNVYSVPFRVFQFFRNSISNRIIWTETSITYVSLIKSNDKMINLYYNIVSIYILRLIKNLQKIGIVYGSYALSHW